MTYEIIATGSTGNAVLINDSILIDCGVPFKKLEPYAKQIQLVLLTHVHGDHFKASTVKSLHKQRPSLRWGCCEWMVMPLLQAGVDKRVIDVLIPEKQYGYGEYQVLPAIIPHNVPNCGYKILHLLQLGKTYKGDKWEKLFYATDCATLDGVEAKDYDYYFIERNYEDGEIKARIAAKHAAGKMAYETNVIHNHLSEKQAIDWLSSNDSRFPNGNYVFLHQHQERGRSTTQ